MAVCALAVVLKRVPVTKLTLVPTPPPVNDGLETIGAEDQEYTVLVGTILEPPLAGLTTKVTPLQVVAVNEVIVGLGSILIVTEKGDPTQELNADGPVGVTT